MISTKNFQKFDDDKPQWHKFAWKGAALVLRIMHFGAAKYGWDNWKEAKVEDRDRLINAAYRHMTAWSRGECYDPESGYHHLMHAACNLLFWLHFLPPEYQHRDNDPRQRTSTSDLGGQHVPE